METKSLKWEGFGTKNMFPHISTWVRLSNSALIVKHAVIDIVVNIIILYMFTVIIVRLYAPPQASTTS